MAKISTVSSLHGFYVALLEIYLSHLIEYCEGIKGAVVSRRLSVCP